jgi:hypothetical protein
MTEELFNGFRVQDLESFEPKIKMSKEERKAYYKNKKKQDQFLTEAKMSLSQFESWYTSMEARKIVIKNLRRANIFANHFDFEEYIDQVMQEVATYLLSEHPIKFKKGLAPSIDCYKAYFCGRVSFCCQHIQRDEKAQAAHGRRVDLPDVEIEHTGISVEDSIQLERDERRQLEAVNKLKETRDLCGVPDLKAKTFIVNTI